MKNRKYIRDGRAPIPDNEATSYKMSKVKGKNTKPEILVRRALFGNRLRGYRIHLKIGDVRPDIVFTSKKVAIFVHGCFWHSCPHCNLGIPAKHSEFWSTKLHNNLKRDENKKLLLIELGWEVIICWECEIYRDINNCVMRVKNALYRY